MAEEREQQLITLSALPEDLSLAPRTRIGWCHSTSANRNKCLRPMLQDATGVPYVRVCPALQGNPAIPILGTRTKNDFGFLNKSSGYFSYSTPR